VYAVPDRIVFEWGIIGWPAESLHSNSTFVQGIAMAGDFPLANVPQQGTKLIRTMERTAGQHSLQRFAFFRFPNHEKDRFHHPPQCLKTVYDQVPPLSSGRWNDWNDTLLIAYQVMTISRISALCVLSLCTADGRGVFDGDSGVSETQRQGGVESMRTAANTA